MTGRRVRRRAREEVTRRRIGSVKDYGPTGHPSARHLLLTLRTGQTTGQRVSDPSGYRVSITGYYNILLGIKPVTTQKNWLLLSSNAHITKYKTRQDNECRRAQVYPLCPHLHTIHAYHFILLCTNW